MKELIVVDIKEFTGLEHTIVKVLDALNTNNCPCGAESVYGCHGVRDREAYSEYFCRECKNKREF